MHKELVDVEKALLYKRLEMFKIKLVQLFILILSVGLMAQETIKDPKDLMVFQPDEQSKKFNEVYTQNFFFGNFGIKPLVNAIPIDYSKVRSIRISAEKGGKKTSNIMELYFNQNGNIEKLKVSEMLAGTKREVIYKYQDGLIVEEKFNDPDGAKVNQFYYANGKMIVKTIKGMVEVYDLNGEIFTKQSYLDGKLVFKDRLEGKCRITTYLKEDIDKVCYSNFNSELPLTMEEFVSTYDATSKKNQIKPENKWEVKKMDDLNYSILRDARENYQVKLDKNKRVKSFEFLGSKADNVKPVSYTFAYTYY